MRRRLACYAGLCLLLLTLPHAGIAAREVAQAQAINPLTGLPVTEPANLLLNPVIAKISNAPAEVRPQAGLEAADLVFEHYAEGGLTRFSAVFHGQRPTRVGSIRSARLIDVELLPMFQGLLAWSGASIGVDRRLNATAHPGRLLRDALYEWPFYWREPGIPTPHNLFVDVAALGDLARNEGLTGVPPLHGLSFRAQPPAGDLGGALLVQMRYLAATVDWVYHGESGFYYRYADGAPHLDTQGAPLRAANVVALYADHRFTDIVESVWQGVTHYSIEIDLGGGGEGLLFRDGRQYALRWHRPASDGMLRFSDRGGAALALRPGNTWLQVMRPPAQQDGVEGLTVLGGQA